MSLGGGVIQALGSNNYAFHWINSNWIDDEEKRFELTRKIIIGTAVKVNKLCLADECRLWAETEEFLDPLETFEPFWEQKERQARISLGQYANIQTNVTYAK
jgi:hypothetical protein